MLPRALGAWIAVLVLLGGAGTRASAETPVAAEYQVKAVFLYNFTQFVEWDPRRLGGAQDPLVIGVLGDNPFGTYLDELVKGERILGHPLAVRHYRAVEDVGDCRILFISRSLAGSVSGIVSGLKGRRLLTVGDSDNFCRQGGMVGFATENGKIRLRINVGAAGAAGLKISSKLLRLATIVATKD